jgi:hypothetical protein
LQTGFTSVIGIADLSYGAYLPILTVTGSRFQDDFQQPYTVAGFSSREYFHGFMEGP